jgi:hypothetical protein
MYRLRFSPRTVALVLLVIVTSLLVAGLATQYIKYFHGHDTQLGFVRLLHLDGENNVPAWYSCAALLLCSAVLGIIGLHHRQAADKYARHWLALAIVFLYLSIDEGASIHEMADLPIHHRLEAIGYLDAILPMIGMAWVLAGVLFSVIVFLAFWRFLLHLPIATRLLFLVAGGLYVGGAVGLEAVEGRYFPEGADHTFILELIVALEEALEMLGVILFLYSLMAYMAEQGIRLEIVVIRDRHD